MTRAEAVPLCGNSFSTSDTREDPPDDAVCHTSLCTRAADATTYISSPGPGDK